MSNSDEAFRYECEVLHISRQPLKKRREILDMIEKARGKEEKERLQNSLVELWKKRK
jgi:hypothetical protein